jgi:hypothetical protein
MAFKGKSAVISVIIAVIAPIFVSIPAQAALSVGPITSSPFHSTGGGGGGIDHLSSGAGGSGIVVVRYVNAPSITLALNVKSYTVESGSYRA